MDVYSHTAEVNVKTIPAVSTVVFIALFEDHEQPKLHPDSFRTTQ